MLHQGMLLGPYRIVRFLAKGTNEVYLAEDPRIPREVAIKVMQTVKTEFPNTIMLNDAVNEFQREARMISRLGHHSNILPLFDYGQEITHGIIFTYLVMPYQENGTLAGWLLDRSVNGSSVLTPIEANNILNLAAKGLQYAHNRNVVHRDVKPSNFLIGDISTKLGYPDILLSDFGIARPNEKAAPTGPAGTPFFMAPEQWKGHPVPATDQYALAIMIFLLLTGRYPFEGDLPVLMHSHINEIPPHPSSFNSQLSPEIDNVLLRALEKDPQNRYPSVTAFAEAFENASMSLSPDPGPVPPPDPGTTIPPDPGPPKISLRFIVIASFIALIIFITATSGEIFSYVQQRNHGFDSATATAQIKVTATAKAKVTATAQANSTAIAQASATAAAQTTAIASGQLVEPIASEVINEHFANGHTTNQNLNGWQSQNGANFSCLLSKAGYSITETVKSTSEACFAENQSFDDFTYQVAFTITGGDCAGIVFRSDSGNANYYVFYICTNHSFYFYKYENNQITKTFYMGTSNSIRTGSTDINVIAVVAKRNSLHFFVNSNPSIYNPFDNSYKGGEIGAIAVDQGKPTTVVFLTAQVYNL